MKLKGRKEAYPASRRRGVPDHLAPRDAWTFLGLGVSDEAIPVPIPRMRKRIKTKHADL